MYRCRRWQLFAVDNFYFFVLLFTSSGYIYIVKRKRRKKNCSAYTLCSTSRVHSLPPRTPKLLSLGNKVIFYVFILLSAICPHIHADPGGTIFPIMAKVFQRIQLQLQFKAYVDFGSNSGHLVYFYV